MEVLVVTVILVIGILVVLKSYPAGFTSIRHSENISMAGRLAQHEMEFWKDHAANLPEGILAINPGLPPGSPDLDQLPGPPMTDENASRFRQVIGEITKVPVGTYYAMPSGNDIASVYVLGFSPVRVVFENGRPANLSVYGGKIRGIPYDSGDENGNPGRWLGQRYAIDYDAKQIFFRPPSANLSYYISYSYYLSSDPTKLYQVVGATILVTPSSGWTGIPDGAGNPLPGDAVIDEGSESVARSFNYLATAANWSGDPYEYKLIDPIVGTLAFSPNGYQYKESTALGTRLLEAHIDYEILNLQVLREDHMIPNTSPFRIKLTLPFVKQAGVTMEANDTVYRGLGDGAVAILYDGANPYYPDVLIVNPADGAKLFPIPMTAADYKAGAISFATNIVSALMPDGTVRNNYDIAGKNLRFYYQAENDWSVQLQKAFENYTAQDFAAPYDVNYRQFLRDGNKLYFKKCDCEKTVTVTYKWNTGTEVLTEVGESHQISPDWVTFAGKDFSFVTLNHAPAEITEVVSVTGVSLLTRAVWRERKKWLHVDLDSSLTRRPTEL
jgi:hypothetical protein